MSQYNIFTSERRETLITKVQLKPIFKKKKKKTTVDRHIGKREINFVR
jgi:hypothetical protein